MSRLLAAALRLPFSASIARAQSAVVDPAGR
jgi:hypothetical protein